VTQSDSELIARVVSSDDRAAFGELVRRHQSAVRRFLRCFATHDSALADDIAQETFIRAYHGLSRYRGEGCLSTWLLGIAHNQWRNAQRRQRTERLAYERDGPAETAPSPAPAADLKHDLTAALAQLSEEERTSLHLCYQRGLSHSEASGVLGCDRFGSWGTTVPWHASRPWHNCRSDRSVCLRSVVGRCLHSLRPCHRLPLAGRRRRTTVDLSAYFSVANDYATRSTIRGGGVGRLGASR
jgi:RNA polymerase sigma factor (sigma-70 family)